MILRSGIIRNAIVRLSSFDRALLPMNLTSDLGHWSGVDRRLKTRGATTKRKERSKGKRHGKRAALCASMTHGSSFCDSISCAFLVDDLLVGDLLVGDQLVDDQLVDDLLVCGSLL